MSSCTKPPAELPQPAATALAVPTILHVHAATGQGWGDTTRAGKGTVACMPGQRRQARCIHRTEEAEEAQPSRTSTRRRLIGSRQMPHRGLNITEHQNWQATKAASEKPMKNRAARYPPALSTAAMPASRWQGTLQLRWSWRHCVGAHGQRLGWRLLDRDRRPCRQAGRWQAALLLPCCRGAPKLAAAVRRLREAAP